MKCYKNFLTNEECDKYIDMINDNIKNGINNKFTNNSSNYNNKQINQELANFFHNRLISIDSNFKYNFANKLIMTAKYNHGEQFSIHTDTGLYYDSIKKLKTTNTALIYLNDSFDGGETIFYDDKFNITKKIKPVKGMLIVFDIDQFHSGSPVYNGNKYWIGYEIVGSFI
jgi:predicted 2-oxoglutarate/Fe(II)-dependent dioxygenase YbiX